MLSAGTCTVQADQAGNASFQPAAPVLQNIVINQASQTISFTPVAAQTFTPSATFGLSATGGASGNAVVFASTTSGVCTVSGNTVSMVSAGTCTIAADQAGNANYAAATQVSQNITIGKAAQTISFTTSPPTVAVASGNGYSVAATGGVSGNPVVFSVDAASGAGVCSIAGSTVSFLTPGSCIIDANQAASANYAAATQVQQTIAVQNSKGKTTQAIATFINTYDNQVVGNLFSMDRTIDRLEQADEGNESSTQFENSPPQPSRARTMQVVSGQNGVMLPATGPAAGASASADAYGMQQMLYNAMQQLGDTQAVNQLNYSGPFDASMNIHDLTGSFHTSLSQMIKWDDQRQQKDAESLGLNTSGHGPATFMPLDVWMQGSYAAVNATQQGTFGEISTGVDYVFNRNLLLGAFAQLDFMNQTTGPGAAGTGWLIGPYGTLRLTDHMFFEARGGYGRSNNTMADPVSPALQDQFGSTRLLASASLAGR